MVLIHSHKTRGSLRFARIEEYGHELHGADRKAQSCAAAISLTAQ
jgi:hypothetical protein